MSTTHKIFIAIGVVMSLALITLQSDGGFKVKDWRSFKPNFGKYKGQTLQMIRIIDMPYIFWVVENMNNPPKEFFECVEYANTVDKR
jgi:hypothetical protein